MTNQDMNKTDPQIPQDNFEPKYEFEPTMPPLKAAFMGLIAVFLLYQFGGAILTLIIFGFDIENANVNALRLMTMAGQVLLILLPALMFSKLVYEDVSKVIRFRLPDWKGAALLILGLIILTPLLQSFLYIQNYLIEIAADAFPAVDSAKEFFDQLDQLVEETYGKILQSNSILDSFLIILIVAITPAICEEVFFRGFIQTSFEYKFKPFYAALITALFFALYHFSPYGFIGLAVLGLYFGFAAYLSNSMLVPVILHFLNNFFAVSLYLIFGDQEYMEASAGAPDEITQYFLVFLFLLIIFFLLIFGIKKYYHKLSLTEGG